MDIHKFLEKLEVERSIAILRTDDQAKARDAMEAAVRGGFCFIEFTLSIPGALDLINEFRSRDGLIVGVGTVLTADQARDAIHAGAQFLVSPVLNDTFIRIALENGLPAIPGTHTPTEMWKAYQAGAPLQKVFPSPAGGPDYLQAVLGPMPFLRLVPTHWVNLDNYEKYLNAGAFALGFTRSLFDPSDIKAGRMNRIEQRARAIHQGIHRWSVGVKKKNGIL